MATVNLTKTVRKVKPTITRIQPATQHLVEYMPTRKPYAGRVRTKPSCWISKWTILVRDLEVGQGFVVPTKSERLTAQLRHIASVNGKKFGRKFPVRRIDGQYVYITREM